MLASWLRSTADRDVAIEALQQAKLGPGSYCVRRSGKAGWALTCFTEIKGTNADYQIGHYRFQGTSPRVELLDVPELKGEVMDTIAAWVAKLSVPSANPYISTVLTACIPCPAESMDL
jgi:hypothetical protein